MKVIKKTTKTKDFKETRPAPRPPSHIDTGTFYNHSLTLTLAHFPRPGDRVVVRGGWGEVKERIQRGSFQQLCVPPERPKTVNSAPSLNSCVFVDFGTSLYEAKN